MNKHDPLTQLTVPKGHTSAVQRAIVIYSPYAGRSTSLSRALRVLERFGVEVVKVLPISRVADAPALGQQWKESGIDLVVAAGGDGLVGSVIAHLLDGQLPLGILPLGTANDLARSVGIPQDLSSAAKVIAFGASRVIDLGLARPLVFDGQSASHFSPSPGKQRLFAHALNVGFSVQFAHLATNKGIRQRYGRLTYPFALWWAARRYRPIDAEIHFRDVVVQHAESSALSVGTRDHLILRCRIAQVAAVNAPVYWGALKGSVPGVEFTDRTLDVVILEDASRHQLVLRMLRFFASRYPSLPNKRGWHARYPDLLPVELTDIPGIHHIQARSVTILTEDEPQAVTLDGEVYMRTPVEACVADERLWLLVPDAAAHFK